MQKLQRGKTKELLKQAFYRHLCKMCVNVYGVHKSMPVQTVLLPGKVPKNNTFVVPAQDYFRQTGLAKAKQSAFQKFVHSLHNFELQTCLSRFRRNRRKDRVAVQKMANGIHLAQTNKR